MKRFITYLIVLAMLLTIQASIGTVLAVEEFCFIIGNSTPIVKSTGEIVTIQISVENNPGFNAVGLQVTFDTNDLQPYYGEGMWYKEVQSELLINKNIYDTGSTGSQRISLINGEKDLTGDVAIIELTFKVIKETEGNTSVSIAFTTVGGTPSNVAAQDVEATIKSPCVITVNNASTSAVTLTGRVSSYNPRRETMIALYITGTKQLVALTTIEAQQDGSGITTQKFTLNNVPGGVYDLVVSKQTHLDFSIIGVTVGASDLDLTMNPDVKINTISLLCGDINGDGFINSTDLSILILPANYGKSTSSLGVDPMADLTGIGWVDSSALSVIILPANYNKTHITYVYNANT